MKQYTKNAEGTVYMMLLNNSGIERSVANGEIRLPEATETAVIDLKDMKNFKALETDGEYKVLESGKIEVTIPAGGYFFASME